MSATEIKKELQRLAKALERGENPRRVAAQLRQLAERRAGHPTDPAMERLARRLRRALMAESIYRGQFPPARTPDGLRISDRQDGSRLDLERAVLRCKGSRGKSDRVAAKILNTSERQVRAARREFGEFATTWRAWTHGEFDVLGAIQDPKEREKVEEEIAAMLYLAEARLGQREEDDRSDGRVRTR